MVKFRLPGGALPRLSREIRHVSRRCRPIGCIVQILVECRQFEFEEIVRKIRRQTATKHRFAANDSFSPVC